MTCPDATERIEAILDGTLPPSERAEIEAHLAGCRACAWSWREVGRPSS